MNFKTKTWLNKLFLKFPDNKIKYDYSKSEFFGSNKKIKIICHIHGEFEQRADGHLNGRGCPKCGLIRQSINSKKSHEQWLLEVNKIHNNFYIYPEKYKGSEYKLKIICPIHGEFEQLASSHLKGHKCLKCNRKPHEQWLIEVNKIHNNFYIYPEKYISSIEKIKIICPIHGEFEQLPYQHLQGNKCNKCSIKLRTLNNIKSHTNWLKEINIIHKNIYNYPEEIKSSKQKVNIICSKHGNFYQRIDMHLKGHSCPSCSFEKTVSKAEQEIVGFIKSLGIENIQQSNRSILNGKELDIYLPDHNLAIEFNGLYWHDEYNKEDNYHLLKTEECLSKGITLIHIFEDEWLFKKEIVKSRISNLLNKIGETKTIYARKCFIKEIDSLTARKFLENNHLQGFVGAKVHLGLFYKHINKDNETKEYLVSYMSFGNLRKNLGQKETNDNHYELLRFCNFINYRVVGGASKLLKYFERNYKPEKIISYADRRWSKGNLYNQLGFIQSHISKPNYFYVEGNKRHNRFNYRKDILISKYNCKPEMTEKDFCRDVLGLSRIYDCGNLVYIK